MDLAGVWKRGIKKVNGLVELLQMKACCVLGLKLGGRSDDRWRKKMDYEEGGIWRLQKRKEMKMASAEEKENGGNGGWQRRKKVVGMAAGIDLMPFFSSASCFIGLFGAGATGRQLQRVPRGVGR